MHQVWWEVDEGNVSFAEDSKTSAMADRHTHVSNQRVLGLILQSVRGEISTAALSWSTFGWCKEISWHAYSKGLSMVSA